MKLPFVFSNFAMTADGKIAFADHEFEPFSSERDREHMMELRATADAIICGARTVEVTETILGNGGEHYRRQRLENGLAEFPLRVIASGSGSIEPAAPIFRKRFSPVIVLTTERIPKAKFKKLQAVADEVKISGKKEINFRSALIWLRKKWNVKRLLCEGGGEIHGALIRANLVDELHLTICPAIFGGRITSTIADGGGFAKLIDSARFKLKSFEVENDELFTIYKRR
ncbi:MAG TPA: RibD family protein [Verrucomicrobiae bacterium]|nr:RibD family protein [Verrucomicrobiae bacterium]